MRIRPDPNLQHWLKGFQPINAYTCILECIRKKNLIIVPCVLSHFHWVAIWRNTQKHIQERSLLAVPCAHKHVLIQVTWKAICWCILGRNPSNVNNEKSIPSVRKLLRPLECSCCSEAPQLFSMSQVFQPFRCFEGAIMNACRRKNKLFCSNSFSSKMYLQAHLKLHSSGKPHKFWHCLKAFVQSNVLWVHLKTRAEVKQCSCSFV